MTNGTVVVTGASTGIGAATCRHVAGLGFDVLAGVRREEDAALVESWSGRVRAQRLDVTEPDQVAALATAVTTAPGPLRALVNNAGIAVVGPVEALTVEDWRQQLEVNVLGQVAVTRTLLPRLIDARGRIVMMSSIGGLVAGPLFGPNSASKFAIEAFTDVLRREVGPLGVRVVAIEPGAIATPIWERGRLAATTVGRGSSRRSASRRPAGRRGPRARRPRLAGRATGRGRGDGGRPGPDRATASHPVPGRERPPSPKRG